MNEEFKAERQAVARMTRRIYKQRLTTTSGGNVSQRVEGDRLVITPAAIDKSTIRWRQVSVMTIAGENLSPELKPSSEHLMHLRIYERHPDVHAIVHAHPLYASTLACTDIVLERDHLCEIYALLDPPVVAPYAMSSTNELAEIVAECASHSSAILMSNHAVTTTGATLLQAFNRLELLEYAAQVTLIARQIGGLTRLNAHQKAELDQHVGRY